MVAVGFNPRPADRLQSPLVEHDTSQGMTNQAMNGRYWDQQMETLPVERRQVLREHRLRWQIRRCWDGSPFYRARLEGVGLDPATFGGLVDWSRFPILRADDLPDGATAEDATSAWTVAPEAWWQDLERAGGRVRRVLTDGDVTHRADLAARALWAAGGRPDRALVLNGANVGDPTFAAIRTGANRTGMPVQLDPHAASRASGDVLTVVVSATCDLTSTTATSGDHPPVAAWTTAWPPAPGPDAPRLGALSIAFVAPTVAYVCEEGDGLHWSDDHFLIEIVDPATGDSAGPGTPGALVVTDLAREGSPLLRFWTGLETALIDETCRCGRTSARSPFVRSLT